MSVKIFFILSLFCFLLISDLINKLRQHLKYINAINFNLKLSKTWDTCLFFNVYILSSITNCSRIQTVQRAVCSTVHERLSASAVPVHRLLSLGLQPPTGNYRTLVLTLALSQVWPHAQNALCFLCGQFFCNKSTINSYWAPICHEMASKSTQERTEKGNYRVFSCYEHVAVLFQVFSHSTSLKLL